MGIHLHLHLHSNFFSFLCFEPLYDIFITVAKYVVQTFPIWAKLNRPAKHTNIQTNINISKKWLKVLYWLVFFRSHYFICCVWFLFVFGFVNSNNYSKEQKPVERNITPPIHRLFSLDPTSITCNMIYGWACFLCSITRSHLTGSSKVIFQKYARTHRIANTKGKKIQSHSVAIKIEEM